VHPLSSASPSGFFLGLYMEGPRGCCCFQFMTHACSLFPLSFPGPLAGRLSSGQIFTVAGPFYFLSPFRAYGRLFPRLTVFSALFSLPEFLSALSLPPLFSSRSGAGFAPGPENLFTLRCAQVPFSGSRPAVF